MYVWLTIIQTTAYESHACIRSLLLKPLQKGGLPSYSPLIEKIIEGSNVVLNDKELEAIVRGARGSFRNLVHNVERYVTKNGQDPATLTI